MNGVANGTVWTARSGSSLLVVAMGGHASNATLRDLAALLDRELQALAAPAVILDATGLGGLDADLRQGGLLLLSTLRARGAPFAAVASPRKAVRMIGSAISFAARYPVSFVDRMDEAHALVEAHARRAGPGKSGPR